MSIIALTARGLCIWGSIGIVYAIIVLIFRVYRSLLVLPYLNITKNSSLEDFEREVLAHPVFLLQPAI
jgi:hypothetical protein